MGSNVRHLVPDIARPALDAVYRHVYRDPANEVGGILVGRRQGSRLRITASIEAQGAEGDVTSLTFTHEAWAAMLAEMDAQHPDAEIIGWYHSHPGHGIFLSEHDRFIHRNFFSAAWHVAFVVDPQRHTEGLFAWTPDGLNLVAGGDGSVPLERARGIEISEEDLEREPETTVAALEVTDDALAPSFDAAPAEEEAVRPGIRGLVLPIGAGALLGAVVGYLAS